LPVQNPCKILGYTGPMDTSKPIDQMTLAEIKEELQAHYKEMLDEPNDDGEWLDILKDTSIGLAKVETGLGLLRGDQIPDATEENPASS
jgi:hypothetical protein